MSKRRVNFATYVILKNITIFPEKFSEYKNGNIKRGVKHYYDNKDKNQFSKKFMMRKIEINYCRNKRNTDFEGIRRSYVEIQNRLKVMEGNLKNISVNESESYKTFVHEIYSKLPTKNYATKKTDVYNFDGIWSSDILDSKDYGPENKRDYRYVFVVIDKFSKFGWTVFLKIETF